MVDREVVRTAVRRTVVRAEEGELAHATPPMVSPAVRMKTANEVPPTRARIPAS